MKGLYTVHYLPEEFLGKYCEIELYNDPLELAMLNFLKFVQGEDGCMPLSERGQQELTVLRAEFNVDEYSTGMYSAAFFFLQNASDRLLEEFASRLAKYREELGGRTLYSPADLDTLLEKYCYAIKHIRKPIKTMKRINSHCSTKVPLAFCFRTNTDCDGYAKHWCSDQMLYSMLKTLAKTSFINYSELESACYDVAIACGLSKYSTFIMLQALMLKQLVLFFSQTDRKYVAFEDATEFAIKRLL